MARGLALLAMAVYHFTWDLEFFHYVPAGMTAVGGWKLFARCIASTFLLLVGISLALAHSREIRWRGFLARLARIVAAALLISLATWYATPDAFIFFGILHQIALASLIGLAFLSLPWPLILLVAAGVVALPFLWAAPVFDHPWLWWVGLSQTPPRSNDYVPVFPWFGAVLAGIAVGRFALVSGLAARLAGVRFGAPGRPLRFIGRHSLAFYLIHQPVLISCLWLFAQVFPAPRETPRVEFRQACERSCQSVRDEGFCMNYCECMLDRLEADGTLGEALAGREDRARIAGLAEVCTAETDESSGLGDGK